MRKKSSFLKVMFLTILSVLCLPFGLGFTTPNARSEIFIATSSSIDNLTNGKFTVTTDAFGRKNVAVMNDKVSVTTKTDEHIEYYCYKWRDLSYLTFSFSSNISQELDAYTYYRFTVSYIQTEDLETSTGLMTPARDDLLHGDILGNSFSVQPYYFYIDSDAQFNQNATDRSKGNGFGLYRFQFLYTITEDTTIGDEPVKQQYEMELGSIYIAVMPDDIQTVSIQDLAVRYSVSSSDRLMNVYNLYLSAEDDFKYVNPNFIEWTVIGKDRANVDYVLSLKMKNSRIAYANYRVVWTSPIDPVGPTFTFDSHNIEGTWTAYCTILNRDGTEKITIQSTELSTLKTPRKGLIWIILGSIVGVIVVGSIVGLIAYRSKKRRSM